MTIMRKILVAAVCGAMSFALVSCGDYVGKEKSHPLYVKGGTCRSSGNFKDAAKYFEEFLLICPKSAKTHYELATLYGDNLDEPFKAIYHYQKYLDLSPVDAADAGNVRQFIEMTKKKAFDKLSEEYKVTPESEKLAKELADSKDKLGKYVEYAKKLKEQNDLMRQRLVGGKKGAALPADKTAAPAGEKAADKAGAEKADAKKAKFDAYKVQAGDTVDSVAKKLLGSASHAKLIREANKGIPANGKLKPGTELKIPALPSSKTAAAKTDKKTDAKTASPAPVPTTPAPSAQPTAQESEADAMGVGAPQD